MIIEVVCGWLQETCCGRTSSKAIVPLWQVARLLWNRGIVHRNSFGGLASSFEAYTSTLNSTMAALRLIAQAARRAPRSAHVLRRGYADVSDKIGLSLVLPHQVRPAGTQSAFALRSGF